MKKSLLSSLIVSGLICLSGPVLADTAVVEMGVPIVVENDSYVVVDKPDYYYYAGHRCYATERPGTDVKVLNLRAKVSGGANIYCYPYP